MEQDHNPRDSHRLGLGVTADHPAPGGWSRGGQNNCVAGLRSGSLPAGGCEQAGGGRRCWHDSCGEKRTTLGALQPPGREGAVPRMEPLMWGHVAGIRWREGQSHRSVSLQWS